MITEELKKHVVEFVEMEQHSYSMDLMICSSQPPDNKERCCRSSRNIEEIIMFICQQSTANACGST